MSKKIEIMFDEKTGKFVVHFSGYRTHDEEHKELDRLMAELKKQGFDGKIEHFHEDPKIPEAEESKRPRSRRKIEEDG